jgi:ATP-dependent DNA helicase DinG
MITIDEFFADSGPLASVIGAGYRERSEQVRLARAISPVLTVGGALLGDGPTGTGKSMAYLAPVALGMREDHITGEVSGRAIVSTATKALQG